MKEDEFEQLYRLFYRPLFLFAYSLTGTREDAEDLVANTFVKALTTFRSGNIQAWMYKVLRNEFLDLKKRRKREQPLEDEIINLDSDTEDVLETYIKNEQKRWLYRQIGQLPEREREIMLLTVQTDYSDQEMGSLLGLSADYIRVLRHRAKQRILKNSEEE